MNFGPKQRQTRWEVPEDLLPRPQTTTFAAGDALYELQLPKQGSPFRLTVNRQQNAAAAAAAAVQQEPAAVFDSAGSRLVFKQKYLEWSTRLHPNTTLYGFGQHVQSDGSLKLPRGGVTLTLWNRAASSGSSFWQNLYGSHPFFLQVAQDGAASGVLLLNSNAMDVQLEASRLTYKVTGGVLDFYFFLGPSPEAVLQQYQAVVGRPAMPPYWSLGFHNSRWGYKSVAELANVTQQHRQAGIPLEVMWSDIDHMDRYRDFTFNPVGYAAGELATYVKSLHKAGQRWVPIIDCGIPEVDDDAAYKQGLAADVFIKDASGKPFTGQVWPGATHFPDFLSRARTWPWWKQQLARMHSQVPFDGLWIDMNEPTNFCSKGDQCHLPQTSPLYRLMRTSAAQASQARLSEYLSCALQCKDSPAAIRDSSSSSKAYKVQNGMTFISTQRQMQLAADAATKLTLNHLNITAAAAASLTWHPGARRGSGGRPKPKGFAAVSVSRAQPLELSHRTVPVTAKGLDGTSQYDSHNLYGWAEAAATYDALAGITKKRPFLLTRSTWAGSGRWAAHWSGDNRADWTNLRWSVPALLQSNLWGMPLAGSDICGFSKQPSEELCARWISAGAFYTFSRSHKAYGGGGHEMYRWDSVAKAARRALGMRYRLLPYLYSTFYSTHTKGGSVARPLFFPFPADATAR
ncbi:hypothetical protein OEZ86_003535 [Tetradesmus obliquus]|nr:hypothetical protein OEZ86_003535 [Tetradesmus obliquus]